MLTFRQYLRPQTLEEAYTLCQKKSNVVLGGMLWLKMEQRTVGGVIDLSDLGLDTIEETEEEFRFGAMVTLRQMEQHEGFCAYTQGACADSVKDIVGVQFRNCATIGGSIFGRFGFSDVLTMFQALDTWVELYHGGLMPLREFAQMKFERDILVRVIVKKTPVQMVYRSMRVTKTDFPVVLLSSVLRSEALPDPCSGNRDTLLWTSVMVCASILEMNSLTAACIRLMDAASWNPAS